MSRAAFEIKRASMALRIPSLVGKLRSIAKKSRCPCGCVHPIASLGESSEGAQGLSRNSDARFDARICAERSRPVRMTIKHGRW